MNFFEITGGLGNQMFQYTFARYVESLTGQASVLYLNFYDYVKNDPVLANREFDLSKYNTDFISVKGTVGYRRLIYEPELTDISDDHFLDFFKGYWQDIKFLETIYPSIKKELTLKDSFITDELRQISSDMQNTLSVSMHIRRTDYLHSKNAEMFTQLSPLYYEKALNILSDFVGDDIILYIFSDDPDYVAENFQFIHNYNYFLMPLREAYQDMYLMSHTKHHIIANSSFSWWAAALSDFNDSITIIPHKWFKHDPSPNIYFKKWISL